MCSPSLHLCCVQTGSPYRFGSLLRHCIPVQAHRASSKSQQGSAGSISSPPSSYSAVHVFGPCSPAPSRPFAASGGSPLCSRERLAACAGQSRGQSRLLLVSHLFAFLPSGYAELKLLLIRAASLYVCLRPVPKACSLPSRVGRGSRSCFSSRCQVWKEFVAC